jgi:hypothetical protein
MPLPGVFSPMFIGANSGRRFSIFPAVSGKLTWDLDVDGALVLSSNGTWTLTPQTSFPYDADAIGGGAGSGGVGDSPPSGSNGTATTFNGISAGGGVGGTSVDHGSGGAGGAGGTASGGDTNTNGNAGAAHGAGGAAPGGGASGHGGAGGFFPTSGETGGGGGSGARVQKHVNAGVLVVGTPLTITVGASGAGASCNAANGNSGTAGKFTLT